MPQDLHPDKALSPCHKVGLVWGRVGNTDVYSCSNTQCGQAVARISPETHRGEWLDGKNPLTTTSLRRMYKRDPKAPVPARSSASLTRR